MLALAILVGLSADLHGLVQPTVTVRFVGNRQLEDAALAARLEAGDGYRSTILDDDSVELATLLLYSAYCDRGFIQARIRQERALSIDRRTVTATFYIEEGEPFHIGRAVAFGDTLKLFPNVIAPGEIFNRSKIMSAERAVTRRYRKRGYARVLVTPLTRVDSERRLLDVRFEITPGPASSTGVERSSPRSRRRSWSSTHPRRSPSDRTRGWPNTRRS